jgi:hypothetical protein
MGIITKIKIGVAILLLLAAAYFVWKYRHMQGVITAQAEQIKNQTATIDFLKTAAKIDADTANHQEEINEVVKSGDPQRKFDLLRKLRDLSAPPAD